MRSKRSKRGFDATRWGNHLLRSKCEPSGARVCTHLYTYVTFSDTSCISFFVGISEVLRKQEEYIGEDEEQEEEEEIADGLYEVERICDKRQHRGEWQYLLKWRGYDEQHNSWERASSCDGCQELIRDFERNRLEAAVSPPHTPAASCDAISTSVTCMASVHYLVLLFRCKS